MPAKSKSQQRLFQMALAVRHGKLKKSEVSNSVLNIVNSEMTDEQIKHFTILKESVDQEVEHIIGECESGYATPMNTLGMGGVNINGGPDLITQKQTKRTKIKHKRKMKSIKDYILESLEPVNANDLIYKFYRANIGKENKNEQIGDVVEISRKYYSAHDKGFVFGKPDKYSDWTYVMNIKTEDIKSNSALQKYLDKLNKEDEFYKYYINKNEAENAASKAKQQLTKKHTLESVLKEIKGYKPLIDLGYNYKITTTSQQSNGNKEVECIYINPTWRIRVENNKIKLDNSGWHTYIVPNVQSLYKVLSHKNNETQRQNYSIIE